MQPGRIVMLLVVGGLLCAGTVRGAGFSLYENGGRAMGMGGAFTASVRDASGIFYNPAGLAGMGRGDLQLGVSLIFVKRSFAGEDPYPGSGLVEQGKSEVFTPLHAFWGHPLSQSVAIGFGVYNPFGLEVGWDNAETFTGRFISTRAAVTPFFFNPVAAVSLAQDRLRLGGGVMAVYSSVNLDRRVGIPNPQGPGPEATQPDILDMGTASIEGDNGGLDWGVNAGLQVDITPAVTLGGNFRSGIGVAYEGTATFTFKGTGTQLDPQLQAIFPETQGVSTQISFPAQLIGAVAYHEEDFTLEADVGWTQWSAFDSLKLAFDTDPDLNLDRGENWEDTIFLRVGAEWWTSSTLALRMGYYYDETPMPTMTISPILPDASRHGISLGLGFLLGENWRLDTYGLWVFFPDRSTEGLSQDNYNGTYRNSVGILGLTAGFNY